MLREEPSFDIEYTLSQCVVETNRPKNNAVFDGFVLMENLRSAIPFQSFIDGGTSHWDAVRTLATNIIDVAKHEGDDDKVRSMVLAILDDPQKFRKLPVYIRRQLIIYKMIFHDRGMRQEP